MAETEHFRIYGDMPEARLRERAELLEDYRKLLIAVTNVKNSEEDRAPEPSLSIYLIKDTKEIPYFKKIARASPSSYEANIAGIAIFVFDSETSSAYLLNRYARHFLVASSSSAYPSWYREGFARYFMTAEFTAESILVGKSQEILRNWLLHGEWLQLNQVLANRYRRSKPKSYAVFVAQSWLLTHYFFRTEGGPQKLNAYLAAINKGIDPIEAFKANIDPDIGGFSQKLRNYIYKSQITFTGFQRPSSTPARVRITRLSAAAQDLLVPLASYELTYLSKSDEAAAAAFITDAAAKYPEDPLAERALALVALRLDRDAEAAIRLDKLLQASPDDALLLLWRADAVSWETPEGRAAALRYLVRAFKADPDDWRVLRLYAVVKGARDEKLSERDLDVLGRAWLLAPQVDQIVIEYATALVRADKFKDAARVLATVAADLDDEVVANYAQTLKERAEAADQVGFLAAVKAFNAAKTSDATSS